MAPLSWIIASLLIQNYTPGPWYNLFFLFGVTFPCKEKKRWSRRVVLWWLSQAITKVVGSPMPVLAGIKQWGAIGQPQVHTDTVGTRLPIVSNTTSSYLPERSSLVFSCHSVVMAKNDSLPWSHQLQRPISKTNSLGCQLGNTSLMRAIQYSL